MLCEVIEDRLPPGSLLFFRMSRFTIKRHGYLHTRVALGEPCDQEVTDYFRGRGYDRNSRIPWPCFDHVDVICHDTPDSECRG